MPVPRWTESAFCAVIPPSSSETSPSIRFSRRSWSPEIGAYIQELEDPGRLVLLALMPEFHHGPGPLPELPYIQPGSVPRRLFEAIRQLFVSVARDAPSIVLVDDFQWVDETSVAALEYLR